MKAVCRIMEDMDKKNEAQEGEDAAEKQRMNEKIKGLMKEKEDMKN